MRPILGVVFVVIGIAGCTADPVTVRPTIHPDDPIIWSGRSSANEQLKSDTLAMIRPLAVASTKCKGSYQAVAATFAGVVDPSAFQVTGKSTRGVLERWTITLCGAVEDYMVLYTVPPQGGTDVQVMMWNSPQNPFRSSKM